MINRSESLLVHKMRKTIIKAENNFLSSVRIRLNFYLPLSVKAKVEMIKPALISGICFSHTLVPTIAGILADSL